MKIICCMEHVERALDQIVYECEEAPIIDELTNDEICSYCEKKGVYLVANEFSDTKCE